MIEMRSLCGMRCALFACGRAISDAEVFAANDPQVSYSVMPGLVPPARPKPLRRGEGPGIHVVLSKPDDVDGRDRPGHDDAERDEHKTAIAIRDSLRLAGEVGLHREM
ncbi:hypothetical protein BRAO285_560039 [Bradyrhizobium sp. ORS 285]|nr:hypothetical protein BRAO285_560039 [Bradyrhizobium sp. ORS 285]